MEDGIRRNLDPGPPEERNIYDAIAGGKQVERGPWADASPTVGTSWQPATLEGWQPPAGH